MGAGGSWWAKRKAKQIVGDKLDAALTAFHPANVAGAVGNRVRGAVQAGRWAAEDRSLELRGKLEAARNPAPEPVRRQLSDRTTQRPPSKRR